MIGSRTFLTLKDSWLEYSQSRLIDIDGGLLTNETIPNVRFDTNTKYSRVKRSVE